MGCCKKRADVHKPKVALTRLLPRVTPRFPDTDPECRLEQQEISELLDAATRTWTIDNSALKRMSNDISAVVNCTAINDVVLLRVEREIRFPTRVFIPWNLTLTSYVENTRQENGVFPRSDIKTRIRCPPNATAFDIG